MHKPPKCVSRLFARRKAVANASAASVITLALLGVLIGSGAASTAVGVSDGITWLVESARGQVLQYNPSTRRVERAFQVGNPGDGIHAVQGNGIVALRNERNGEMITVDMSRMRAGGMRASRGNSKVLVSRGMLVVLDGERNRVSRVDPVTAGDVGKPWIAPTTSSVVDVAADDAGTVWVIGTDGTLRGLEWDDRAGQFVQHHAEHVDFVGHDALLAGHDKGVTVFGPSAGVIAQIGTGNDGYRRSNEFIGISPAPVNGPADLVPGALTDRSAIVILDRGQVRRVATNGLGCLRPLRPVAFNDTIYVVCQGIQKVIQFARDGGVAGPAIPMPGPGDAEPLTDEGRLLFNVSGAWDGIEIGRDGAKERFDRLPTGEAQPIHTASTDLGAAQSLIAGREQAREDLAAAAAAEGESPTNASVADDDSRSEAVGPDPQTTAPTTLPVPTPAPTEPPPAPAPTEPPPAPASTEPPPAPAPTEPTPAPTTPAASAPAPRPVEPTIEAPEPPTESSDQFSDPVTEAPAPAPSLETISPRQTSAPEPVTPPSAPEVTGQPTTPSRPEPEPEPSPTQQTETEPTREVPPAPTLEPTREPTPSPSSTAPTPSPSPSTAPSPSPSNTPPTHSLSPTPPTPSPSPTPPTPSPSPSSTAPTPSPSQSSPAAIPKPSASTSPSPIKPVQLPAPVIVTAVHEEEEAVRVTWLPVPSALSYSVQCHEGVETVTTEMTANVPCPVASDGAPARVGVRALGPSGKSSITWAVVVHH